MHAFTNKLINETSPYLLQHAHNPVNWYPWSEEALEKAKAENKVILVSIGYSACHWCHVMERESFENETVAALMNQNFVNIKIDREERPDLDHIYMDAVHAISGSGGWPLNVFLTPEGKPFYGGTYFPPTNAYNRPSWTEVLNNIAKSWVERNDEIQNQANYLLDHLSKTGNFGNTIVPQKETIFTKENCGLIAEKILANADRVWGGFGNAPKFPQTFTIQYLLQYYYYSKDETALHQALVSIDKMLQGGIYDQAGGGFSRYSTDNEWLAPHFEKMLYDNALLLDILCDAFLITKDKKYQKAIAQTIAFLERDMMDEEGGFYAALDADSEGVEGKFYVWDKSEIETILKEDAPLFCSFYDVSNQGNWDHKNILRMLHSVEAFAEINNLDPLVLEQRLDSSLEKLLRQRNLRVRPATDDKILLGWNAMLVPALCKAASALQNESYKQLAIKIMDFILQKFGQNNFDYELFHTYKNGQAKYPAFLDDYASVINACIALQEITTDTKYIGIARGITNYVIKNFSEEESGYFFFSNKNQKDIILRKKEVYDGATPSGNSVMAKNLIYLSIVFNEPEWMERALKMISNLSAAVLNYPTSFAIWAAAILNQTYGFKEIVIAGAEPDTVLGELLRNFIPGKILQTMRKTGDHDFPLMEGKAVENETLIYLCQQYSCKAPVNSTQKLLKLLEK